MRFGLLSLAISCAASLVAIESRAQSTPPAQPFVVPQDQFFKRAPDSPNVSWFKYGIKGVEFEFRGGLMFPDGVSPVLAPHLYAGQKPALSPLAQQILTGDILTGVEQPYSLDPFGLSFTLGYRFLRWLSVGVFFDYASFLVNDGTDTGDYDDTTGGYTSQLQRQVWQLGAYARMYFPAVHPRLHPWIELGAGYSEDTASYTRGTISASTPQPLTVDYYITQYGLATTARAGLDWRLAPIFSVGPVVGYERVFGLKGCVDAEPQSDPSNTTTVPSVDTCSSSVVQTNGYNMFLAGIFAKITLGAEILK